MNKQAPSNWIPILEAGDRVQALSALDELTEALGGLPITNETPCDLGRGLAGRAIALMYLSQSPRYSQVRPIALACLDAAIEGLARGIQGPSLFSGISGIAWAAHHLQSAFPAQLEEGGGEEVIDQCLLDHLEQRPWKGDYDLVSGLVGIGLYAWDGLPRSSAAELLARVVDHLQDLAQPMAQGMSWHTPPNLLPEWQRLRDPEGYFNLGVAHGVPSVINLLARAAAAGIRTGSGQALALEGNRWLSSVRLPAGSACRYGSLVGSGGKPDSAKSPRLAWCYGDLGLSLVLLGAAGNLWDQGMEDSALEIARLAAQRSSEDCQAHDAGFCHGSAGNGHLFNRLYQATGEALFLEAARSWFRAALLLRRPGQGIGGYQSWLKPEHPQGPWLDEPGLLEGSAGIALTLLSACEAIPPHWDRMMLVDLPGRSQ